MDKYTNKTIQLLTDNINQLYCVKSHLVERLTDSRDNSSLNKFSQDIDQIITGNETQLHVLDQVFHHLNTTYSFTKCESLILHLEELFTTFLYSVNDDPAFSYFLLLSYFIKAQAIEQSLGYLLTILTEKLDNLQISKLIAKVVEEDKLPKAQAFIDNLAVIN